ncbi:MAG: ABC transporter ATP-binding protein [Candidatus Omnitrophica bacterium]|nr:ABC transporter ATP-binding protein [Candidatus Omnitrophota bacterium]
MNILEIKGLSVDFKKDNNLVRVISPIDLDIKASEIVGIAGESGSGKTVSTLALCGLLDKASSRINFSSYKIKGNRVENKQVSYLRGRFISYVFQDPVPSLDPMFTVRFQLQEILQVSGSKNKDDKRMADILSAVGLEDTARILNSYPHQLSGGMAQRVAIAYALASSPKLLVLDEPTTALDASLKKGILDLIKKLKAENGLSIIFISHDLNQVFYLADRVYIFYAGTVLEYGSADIIKKQPAHPYTQALLDCIPKKSISRLRQIPGKGVDFSNMPSGCVFHPRCPYASDICQDTAPQLRQITKGHYLSCYRET